MASGTVKVCNPEKQALNRLLMTISDEIEEEKFKKLTRLYDVKPENLQGLDQFGMLQYFHEQGVLDLIENLNAAGCQDQGKKITDFNKQKEHQDMGQGGYPAVELVHPVLDKKPIEEQDGQRENSLIYGAS